MDGRADLEAAAAAIRRGDVEALRGLLAADPSVATARIDGRTLLHVAADWPGHFGNGAAVVAALVAAGADVDARFEGANAETPLHWAASSDDVEVLDALLDAGADIDAPGAVIAGGTPLLDATAFGQWRAARRLVERGAAVGFWEAAALGMLDRVVDACGSSAPPTGDEVTRALWGAAHGGHRDVAAHLVERGADRRWVGWDGLTAAGAARRSGAEELADWLEPGPP